MLSNSCYLRVLRLGSVQIPFSQTMVFRISSRMFWSWALDITRRVSEEMPTPLSPRLHFGLRKTRVKSQLCNFKNRTPGPCIYLT